MIRKAWEFVKHEKFYSVLFIVVLMMCSILWIRAMQSPQALKSSPAIEEFRQAELRLQKKVESPEALQNYLKENPSVAATFFFLAVCLLACLILGCFIDVLALFNAKWRRRWHATLPESQTDWKVSMLVRVALLFIAASFTLGMVLNSIHVFLLPNTSSSLYLLLHTTIVDVLAVYFMIYVIKRDKGNWRELGFRLPEGRWMREVLIGWGGYLGVLPLFMGTLIFLVFLAQLFKYQPPPHPLVNVFLDKKEGAPILIGYSIFLATIIGPLIEEVFFRGFCYQIFKKKFGTLAGMIVTSAFFALIHANTFAFWPIFILGMGLAYLFEKRGSLVAPMVLHVTHNSFFIAYFFIAKNIIETV